MIHKSPSSMSLFNRFYFCSYSCDKIFSRLLYFLLFFPFLFRHLKVAPNIVGANSLLIVPWIRRSSTAQEIICIDGDFLQHHQRHILVRQQSCKCLMYFQSFQDIWYSCRCYFCINCRRPFCAGRSCHKLEVILTNQITYLQQ